MKCLQKNEREAQLPSVKGTRITEDDRESTTIGGFSILSDIF